MNCLRCNKDIAEDEAVLVAYDTPRFNDEHWHGEIWHRRCIDELKEARDSEIDVREVSQLVRLLRDSTDERQEAQVIIDWIRKKC